MPLKIQVGPPLSSGTKEKGQVKRHRTCQTPVIAEELLWQLMTTGREWSDFCCFKDVAPVHACVYEQRQLYSVI